MDENQDVKTIKNRKFKDYDEEYLWDLENFLLLQILKVVVTQRIKTGKKNELREKLESYDIVLEGKKS